MSSIRSQDRRLFSTAIVDRLFEEFDFSEIRVVHLFLSIDSNSEVDTRPLIDRVRADFPAIRIAVPRVSGDDLESLVLDESTQLELSSWNVPEPVDDRFVEPQTIDLVVVPLLAFDRRGYRVGYGKGFYDRFFKTCRNDCLKVGVSFFPPAESIEDTNENDVRLNYCLTPIQTYKFD